MAKKKGSSKKRRQAPPGVDPNEKRRERLEARRRAKAEQLAAQHRAEQRSRILRFVFYVGLIALAIWFFFLRGGGAPEEINGHEVVEYNAAGEGVHEGPYQYETSPPVAGPHRNAIPCGTYSAPVPDEDMIHSLEHGAVYGLYSPELPVEQVRQLEGLAAKEGWTQNFLVAPYENEMPEGTLISIGSWGFRMDLDEFDEDAIVGYYDEFEGTRTAEAGVGCANESDDTFEPEDEEPKAGATPEATPTPEES